MNINNCILTQFNAQYNALKYKILQFLNYIIILYVVAASVLVYI